MNPLDGDRPRNAPKNPPDPRDVLARAVFEAHQGGTFSFKVEGHIEASALVFMLEAAKLSVVQGQLSRQALAQAQEAQKTPSILVARGPFPGLG